jgi:hypothetical protein
MTQLSLFRPDAEAERPARTPRPPGASTAALEARLQKARVAFRTLRAERDALGAAWEELRLRLHALQAESARQRRELDQARLDAQHWKSMYELALLLRTPSRAPGAPALEPILKKLLLLAHPDRWSQGQPATALAHEVVVAINALREEVRS